MWCFFQYPQKLFCLQTFSTQEKEVACLPKKNLLSVILLKSLDIIYLDPVLENVVLKIWQLCKTSFCIKKTTRDVSQYEINATWLIWVSVIGSFLIKRFQFRLPYLEQLKEIYVFWPQQCIYIAEITSLYCLFHVKYFSYQPENRCWYYPKLKSFCNKKRMHEWIILNVLLPNASFHEVYRIPTTSTVELFVTLVNDFSCWLMSQSTPFYILQGS